MRLSILCFSVLMLFNFCSQAQNPSIKFINGFLPMAKKLQNEWGIPVSIILGVSILESGSGTSKNAKQLNNFFGVTGSNKIKTRKSIYKQYATAEDSFEDFCSIISRKRFYKSLKNNKNYNTWLIAMIKANYAGAKSVWIYRVKSIIKKHNLAKHDKVESI